MIRQSCFRSLPASLLCMAMSPFVGSCDRDSEHLKKYADGTLETLGNFEAEHQWLGEQRDSPYFREHYLPRVHEAVAFLKGLNGMAPPFHLFGATVIDVDGHRSLLQVEWIQDGGLPETVELFDEGGLLAKLDIPTADNEYLKTDQWVRMDTRVLLAAGQVANAEDLTPRPAATLARDIKDAGKLRLRVVRTNQVIEVARLSKRERPDIQPDSDVK